MCATLSYRMHSFLNSIEDGCQQCLQTKKRKKAVRRKEKTRWDGREGREGAERADGQSVNKKEPAPSSLSFSQAWSPEGAIANLLRSSDSSSHTDSRIIAFALLRFATTVSLEAATACRQTLFFLIVFVHEAFGSVVRCQGAPTRKRNISLWCVCVLLRGSGHSLAFLAVAL